MPAIGEPLAFPPARAETSYNAPWQAGGLRLRAARDDDLPYLRKLYGTVRAAELAQVDWPDGFKQTFLDSQFALQHSHYVTHYASTDFWIVEHDGRTVGRYYLLRGLPYYRIIDIAMEPDWRGRGVGSALLDWTQAQVRQTGAAGIDLHVYEHNHSAHRLYVRHGFADVARENTYISMRWTNASA
ncbi:N-acetyltransferase [Dyella lipolytica]|uniref:GNAT family N-acetyltransferase n=1 Tax=Dyella lipolytica TaxID=1867835 RepID=A0ABW8IT30_9GAMM|nr:GNAT family N-acetyltransferase [Dyella lipolytica]GLQ45165.1 N-acetyltransferase [Dyella lipolytica]